MQITPSKIKEICPISNPKPDLHNINAHTKFGEIPFTFTEVIIQKRSTDGWKDGHKCMDNSQITPILLAWMDRHTMEMHRDVRFETIIPNHYHVRGEGGGGGVEGGGRGDVWKW